MVLPRLDVVELAVDDATLDAVAVVVEQKDARVVAVADHCRNVLAGDLFCTSIIKRKQPMTPYLERAIADKQENGARRAVFEGSTNSKGCSDREPD